MLLILSARLVNEDIALHYGRLPPSFLPLGNQRLFALQADLADGGRVFMTVPEAFKIPEIDQQAIAATGITLLPQPSSLSLTEAISAAVRSIAPEGPLRLLYGDTLVQMDNGSTAPASDQVVVQHTTSNYPWAFVIEDEQGQIRFSDNPPKKIDTRRVVCGDYTFLDPDLLVEACEAGSIVEALNIYHARRPMEMIEAKEWFDFGHLPLYFQSKKSIMIKRVFNDLAYENHLLIKQSNDTSKIRAEAHWYENLPGDIQIHTPRYRGRVERNYRAGYAVEYLYHPLLSDLVAFGALPLTSWLEIFNASFEFIDKCHAIRPATGVPEASPTFANHFFDMMIVGKTWSRLARYLETSGLSYEAQITLNGQLFPPLRAVVEKVISCIPRTTPEHIRFWHGDLFFGNMFYDFTARRILTIDPRGQLGAGEVSIFGDWRYDLAKLAHSVIGQYDKIILGRSRLVEHSAWDWDLVLSTQPHQNYLEELLRKQYVEVYGLQLNEMVAMTALMFFSMLPLHDDQPDLQKVMLANALRLSAMLGDNAV